MWVSSNFSDYLWLFSFPTSTWYRDCLFPVVYSYFLRQRLTVGPWVCAWGFHSFPLPHRSVSRPGPPCFEYVALQSCVESGRVMPPALFLVLRIALAVWGLLMVPYKFRITGSNSVKNIMGNLTRIPFNLYIAL